MAYSRWLQSRWYTYWLCQDNVPNLEFYEEVFVICSLISFTFEELFENMDACLDKVRRADQEATNEEIEELRGYMNQFLEDVVRIPGPMVGGV